MDQDEKVMFAEEHAAIRFEQDDGDRMVMLAVRSPNYISAFSDSASRLLTPIEKPEGLMISFEQERRNPPPSLVLGQPETGYALNLITGSNGSILRSSSLDLIVLGHEKSPELLLTTGYDLPPTNEELAKRIGELSEEVKELKGQLAQQESAENLPDGQRHRRGRPTLTQAEWEERFQLVRDIERTHQDRGIGYEQACARHWVSYSTFRHWRQKMKADK